MTEHLAPNSLRALLDAYAALRDAEHAFAVASIIRVEGSAFRREGARMLVVPAPHTDFAAVTAEPHTWVDVPPPTLVGALSGGCIESEISFHALDAIRTGRARTFAIDSRLGADDRMSFGAGCGGRVHVLVQPVVPGTPGLLDAVAEAVRERRTGALALITASSETVGAGCTVGDHVFVDEAKRTTGTVRDTSLTTWLKAQAFDALDRGRGTYVRSADEATYAFGVEASIDLVRPPVHLVVCGTGADARALVHQARVLGWETTVVGMGSGTEVALAIPEADHALTVHGGANLPRRLRFDARTAVVVMTHNFDRDRTLVSTLAPVPLPYLGLLGSHRRTGRLVDDLAEAGIDLSPERLRSPVGLDLGAETPEEIALATCAEILALLSRDIGRPTTSTSVPTSSPASFA